MKTGEMFLKNYFFKDFGQKWKVKDGSVVFQKIFNRGFTVAVFSSCGTMPVVRDVLMMLAMVSKRMSRLSYRSVVEMGLRSQDFAGLLLIIFKTKPSMTGSKVCKGSPKPLGHRATRQFIGILTYMYFLPWGSL